MKYFIISILGIYLLSSCACHKEKGIYIENPYSISTTQATENIETTQSIKVFPNHQIDYKKDNIGMGYYQIIPGDKTVFLYVLDEKPVDKTLRDAGYKEEVIFEIEGRIKPMQLTDKELSKVKLLVGMHGFFKRAGVYPVTKGQLKIDFPDKKKMKIYIKIDEPVYRLHKKEITINLPIPKQK